MLICALRLALLHCGQRWRQRRRLAQDRAQLLAMEERELRDLGLGRDAVPHLTAPPAPAPAREAAGAGRASAHEAAVAPDHGQLDETRGVAARLPG